MTLIDFFQNYFVNPIILGTGYNPINTSFYGFLFIVFTYLIYEFLKKIKIKFDNEFILSITPWVIFGIILRILEDAGILKSYLFVTPNIWLLFTFLISLMLVITKLLEKKFEIPYFKIMFISGIILVGAAASFLRIRNFQGLVYTFVWFLPWVIAFSFISWSLENKLTLLSQLFDATTTFVSLQYFNYFELHFLPRKLIELTGTPFSFVVVKFVVVLAALKILDQYQEDREFINYLKFVIALLGFITGLRDFLRLVMFV
jgi:uncharacterized membrane protein